MSKHLQDAIDKLWDQLIDLSAKVEKNLGLSIKSFEDKDIELARQVIDKDGEIDQREIDIEEECLKILALHQPVAIDLRFIISVMKINNDLERIGDLSSDIAGHTIDIVKSGWYVEKFNYSLMYNLVKDMLRKSVDSLIKMDADIAESVLQQDDKVDHINDQNFNLTIKEIQVNPEYSGTILSHMQISRRLERIADLATNIAEDTIYLTKGEIVRHRRR